MPPPETTSAAAILGWVARGEAIAAKSFRADAVDFLERNNAPSRAVMLVKAPVAGADMGSLGGVGISAWATAAAPSSAFYRVLSDGAFQRGVANARIALTVIPATGSAIGEGAVIPASPVQVTSVTLTPVKAAALVVVSDLLLLRHESPSGQTSFNRALLNALTAQVDAAFLGRLIADAGTFTATSARARPRSNAKTDLLKALQAVSTTEGCQAVLDCRGRRCQAGFDIGRPRPAPMHSRR